MEKWRAEGTLRTPSGVPGLCSPLLPSLLTWTQAISTLLRAGLGSWFGWRTGGHFFVSYSATGIVNGSICKSFEVLFLLGSTQGAFCISYLCQSPYKTSVSWLDPTLWFSVYLCLWMTTRTMFLFCEPSLDDLCNVFVYLTIRYLFISRQGFIM